MRNNTVVVGGVLIVLATIGAVTYLVGSDRPADSVIGLMVPILSTVVGVVFISGKVDNTAAKVDDVAVKAEDVAHKAEDIHEVTAAVAETTNGTLSDRLERIEQALITLTEGATHDGIVHTLSRPEDRGSGNLGGSQSVR